MSHDRCPPALLERIAQGGTTVLPVLLDMVEDEATTRAAMQAISKIRPLPLDALVESGHLAAPQALAKLLCGMSPDDHEDPEEILRALEKAMPWVVEHLGRDHCSVDVIVTYVKWLEPWADEIREAYKELFSASTRAAWAFGALRALSEIVRRGRNEHAQTVLAALRDDNWHANEAGIRAVASISTAPFRPALERLERAHWSHRVRYLAGKALRGEDLPDPGTRSLHLRHYAPPEGADQGWWIDETEEPWRIEWRGETQVRTLVASGPVERPTGFPSICYDDEFHGEDFVLPNEASDIVAVPGGWLVATTAGEFGGGLALVRFGGTVSTLVRDNFHAFIRDEDRLLAVAGLAHIVGTGHVYAVDTTYQPPRVRGWVELPGAPMGHWIEEDGTILFATSHGLVAVERTGRMEMVPLLRDPKPPAKGTCGESP
jgi:hypothetical protein